MLDAICALIQQAFVERGCGPEGCVMNGCRLRCVGAAAVPEAVYASAPSFVGGQPQRMPETAKRTRRRPCGSSDAGVLSYNRGG